MNCMKCFMAFLIAGIAWCGSCPAQGKPGDASSVPDPAYINKVYFLQTDSLMPLEQVDAEMKQKSKALGFGGNQMGYFMDGARSNMVVGGSAQKIFVVKMAGGMMGGDPTMMIHLYRFESVKGGRQSLIMEQGGVFNRGKSKSNANEIALNVQKKKDDVFLLIPAENLKPGEYAFMNQMQMKSSGMRAVYVAQAFHIE